jgi:AraC-like DNA-binding protein
LRLRDVAAAVGWSEDHFTRRFRAELGLPPMQHLIRLRLRALRRLLLEDDRIALAAAMRRCGFDDPDHGARLFRRQYGVSPRAFRSRYSTGG